MSSRWRTSSIASPSSPMVAALSALSLSGRLTVIVATRSTTDSSIEEYGMRNGASKVGGAGPRRGPDAVSKSKELDLNLLLPEAYGR